MWLRSNIQNQELQIGSTHAHVLEESPKVLTEKGGFGEDMAASDKKLLIAGSRKSQLAIIQTECIAAAIKEKFPQVDCKIETMSTMGDEILNTALPKIGEKSLFTKDLEVALEEGRVNFLVHSLKDLPTLLPTGMAVGTIYPRDDSYDAVIFHPKYDKSMQLKNLPDESVVGTSSLRRIAQLKRRYPHLAFESVRGNLNTRLKKLEEDSKYDAIILASAGIKRMGWSDKIGENLTKDDCLYAVGQGALAVEVKTDDVENFPIYASLTDVNTLLCCAAERMFLRALEGGCSVPIGVWCTYNTPRFEFIGAVLSLDGSQCLKETRTADITIPPEEPGNFIVTASMVVINAAFEEAVLAAEEVGSKVAEALKKQGACQILEQAREAISVAQNDLRLPKSK